MQTAELIETKPTGAISKFEITKSHIDAMVAEFSGLTIKSINDTAGYKTVHEARMKCVKTRTAIDKRRKELTEESRKFVSDVNDVAKQLTAWLAPTEENLTIMQDDIDAEKKRIVREAEEKLLAAKRQRLQERMDALAACRAMRDPQTINTMSDEAFAAELKTAQEADSARIQREHAEDQERQRIEAEQATERIKLAAERAELDKLRAEQQKLIDEQNRVLAEQRAVQAAEQKKIDDAKLAAEKAEADRLAAIEQERLRKEAVERALKEREDAIAREKMENDIRKANEEAARLRTEALRPDKEKLFSVINSLNAIDVPLVSESATAARQKIVDILDDASSKIIHIIEQELK